MLLLQRIKENYPNTYHQYIVEYFGYNIDANNKLYLVGFEEYMNDCLRAGIEYNKEYYSDEDLKPNENLFFRITILPFGGFNTPNLK